MVQNHDFIYVCRVLIVQLFNRNSNTKNQKESNFVEKTFGIEPMSAVFADFNFAIKGQNSENTFHINTYSFINVKTSYPLRVANSQEVVRRCNVKKVFLEILQNSQEDTCARVSFFDKVASFRPEFPIRFTLHYLPPPLLYFCF